MPESTKIAYKALRTNLYYILFTFGLLTFGLQSVTAQNRKNSTENSRQKPTIGKTPLKENPQVLKDTLAPQTKEAIEAIIEHTAEEYIWEDVINKKVVLYNKAVVNYKDINIQAGKITIDYKTNMVWAKGIKDSVGAYSQHPIFKQGNEESSQDSIVFNFKTEKALIYGLKTEQNGIITLGEKTKKMNDSTIFVRGIRFTTSNKTNPDYYLATQKAKIVPNKKIIVGSTNLVIADVPTPIILPFAYLPLTTTKTSGFIVPSYGESNSQGFFLQNGGYYFAGNDYVDLTILGDFYSNSSWGFNAQTSYKVKYKFSGNFDFRYESLIFGLKGFDDFEKRKNYNIRWTHSQDSKASPNSRLSASVNLGSSKYYRQSLNQLNNSQTLTNTLSSSLSYYQKFTDTPFNLTSTVSHTQNTNTNTISMSLPSLQVGMDRLYPFAPKSGSKKGAFQNIGLNYSFKADNQITTTEDDFFTNINADHILEHLGSTPKIFTNVMKEMYRVSQDQALWTIMVPHHRCDLYWDDYTHVRVLTPKTFFMFDQKVNTSAIERKLSDSTFGIYHDVDSEILDVKYNLIPYWKQQLEAGLLGSAQLDINLNTMSNVAETVSIYAKVHKPGRYSAPYKDV